MKCVNKQNFKIVFVQNNSCETYSSLNIYDNSYQIYENAEIIPVELNAPEKHNVSSSFRFLHLETICE